MDKNYLHNFIGSYLKKNKINGFNVGKNWSCVGPTTALKISEKVSSWNVIKLHLFIKISLKKSKNDFKKIMEILENVLNFF